MNLPPIYRALLVALSAFLFCFGAHANDPLAVALHMLNSVAVVWLMGMLVDQDIGCFCALLFSARPLQALNIGDSHLSLAGMLAVLLMLGLYDVATREGFEMGIFALAVVCELVFACTGGPVFIAPVLLLLTRWFRVFWHFRADQRRFAFLNRLAFDAIFWLIPPVWFLLAPAAVQAPIAVPTMGVTSFGLQILLACAATAIAAVALLIWRVGPHATLLTFSLIAFGLLSALRIGASGFGFATSSFSFAALGLCLFAAFLLNQIKQSRVSLAGVLLLTLFIGFGMNGPGRSDQTDGAVNQTTQAVSRTKTELISDSATAELQKGSPAERIRQ